MTYQKPELFLVGAAQGLVLGSAYAKKTYWDSLGGIGHNTDQLEGVSRDSWR